MNILRQYRVQVRLDHHSRVVQATFDAYAWFWFHTQIWIKDPEQRRPYTFIMRDWIYPHMKAFIGILAFWYLGMATWMVYSLLNAKLIQGLVCLALSIFSGWLSAHLIWGSKWIPGEQENPPYVGD